MLFSYFFLMENSKPPMCSTCAHNVKLSSCGACADKGSSMVQKLTAATGVDITIDEVEALKYTCKVIMNSPEDFSKVDPRECQYYFPKGLKLHL